MKPLEEAKLEEVCHRALAQSVVNHLNGEVPEKTIKEQWLEDKQKELRALILQPGQFYEINGILYRCSKRTKKGWELRRFTGSILVPKVNATGTMIQNAKGA